MYLCVLRVVNLSARVYYYVVIFALEFQNIKCLDNLNYTSAVFVRCHKFKITRQCRSIPDPIYIWNIFWLKIVINHKRLETSNFECLLSWLLLLVFLYFINIFTRVCDTILLPICSWSNRIGLRAYWNHKNNKMYEYKFNVNIHLQLNIQARNNLLNQMLFHSMCIQIIYEEFYYITLKMNLIFTLIIVKRVQTIIYMYIVYIYMYMYIVYI